MDIVVDRKQKAKISIKKKVPLAEFIEFNNKTFTVVDKQIIETDLTELYSHTYHLTGVYLFDIQSVKNKVYPITLRINHPLSGKQVVDYMLNAVTSTDAPAFKKTYRITSILNNDRLVYFLIE
jgi:hypothetical protein